MASSGVSVAAEWQLLTNRYYRKPELYQMQWHVDLTRHKIACAPFGGPIAAIRDESKIIQLYSESALRKLRIFTSSGRLLSETPWKNPGGRLIGISWTEDLTLACITQDGTVYSYNIHAELIHTFSLDRDCFMNSSVVDCVFWGNGVVCINEAFQIFAVPDFKTKAVVKMADCGLEEMPHCVAVIEPYYTRSGDVEVLLGVGDHVLSVEEDGVQELAQGVGPLQKMVVSRNGEFVASFTHDGRLLVMSADFNNVIIEYVCESALPPDQVAWCGLDSILLYWDDMLLMVGPYGDPVRYIYDEPIILIPECDGVRILSNTSMEFLHRVPDSTVSIFQIGSTLPAALLYDALDHFDRHSAKADENLRLIRSSLPDAVEACVDASGYEFDVSQQRRLLRAASYGQAFSSHFQRDRIQEMCKTLRVLNAVRHVEIGIPLSIQQYKLLTPSVLINRLINAHKHLLALRISEYLGMNQEVVLMHWTCTKITASSAISDASLLDILLDKLKICKGISYAAVAAHAEKIGRRKLAAMLVEHEPHSSKQIPLLLSIGEEDTALMKATESGDTDLVYLVLFHIWSKRVPLEFFGLIQARPLARDLFISYARCYKHEFLKDFFLSTGQLQDVAFLLWRESWELAKNPMASRGVPLHGPRLKMIEKTQNLFAETKEHLFESKAAEEHVKLLRTQHQLEVDTKQAIFVDSSISDTIRTCIVLGNNRAAMKVKTDFKVSEKRWYWLKVFALATIRDWGALEKFSKEKRPPIGYRPFVEACIDAGEKGEALKYIPKLGDLGERAEAYARIGMAKEAADAASQAKDGELLGRLRLTFAQNAAASSIFDTLRDRLSFQGDELQVKVNKLTSTKTQLPYDYYFLQYCKPDKISNVAENLGEVLRGDRIENSMYTFRMREEQSCAVVCKVRLDDEATKNFKEKIDDQYRVNMILDNLPIAVLRRRRDGSPSIGYEHGFPVGFKASFVVSKEEMYFIYNHLSFRVMYHRDPKTDSARIVGFEVTPSSIYHDYKEWDEKIPKVTCNQNIENVIQMGTVPHDIDKNREVIFTYDVTFKYVVYESDIKWASRWDTYLLMNDDQIHWFSIINSLVIVLFLSGMVVIIMMRTLYRDIANYNQLETQDDAQEETGWKLLHGDVFRAPINSGLLCVYVGTGVQIFGMTLVTMIFALLGFLSPSNRGGLMKAMVLLWVFMGLFAGYSSARLYKMFKGTKWKRNTLKSAFMFPGILFAVFFVLNAIIWGEKSSGAIPFGTMFSLLCLWFGISVPLVFVGSYLGFKKPAIEDPVKTNKIPRQIPEQPWYMKPLFSILVGGILPFGAVFIELFFILTSIWLNQFYYIFGFLFIVFVILIVTCAEITIVFCYLQLCGEDYQWWWRAYLTAGSSALYLFLYSIFYFFTKLEITKLVSGILYFGYMLIASYAFFVLTGTIGFYVCFWFVRMIYSSVKID